MRRKSAMLSQADFPTASLRQQFDVPIKPVAPAIVKEIGRKGAAVVLQLPTCRADRCDVEAHFGFTRRPSAFFEVAGCARGRDVLPSRAAPVSARHDVIEGQIIADAAILTLKPVPQEHVESRERRVLRRFDIGFERNDRRQFHRMRGRMNLALVMVDNVDSVEKHCLDSGLPRPDTKRIIAEWRIIGIEDKRRASVGMADKIGVVHALPASLSCPRGLSGQMVTDA